MAVPYSGVPEVAPVATGGAPYQSTSASPESFGGPVARGQQQLGAATVQAAQGGFQASRFYGEVAADGASNEFQDKVNKILHGDPEKTTIGADGQPVPDLGYLALKGADALRARPQVEKQFDQLLKDTRAGLPSAQEQLRFDQFSRRFRSFSSAEVGRHADRQANVWYTEVNKASAKTAMDHISYNWDNPDQVRAGAADLTNAYVKMAEINGAKPGDVLWTQAVEHGRRDALQAQLNAMAVKDPARALRTLENDENRKIAGAQYDDMANRFRARAYHQMGTELGDVKFGQALPLTNGADTAEVIRHFEVFRGSAYWDVNHWRVGYGSDTVTRPDGSTVPVTASTVVTKEEAERDLASRIRQTEGKIRSAVGAATWDGLDAKAKASLSSVAYNYGTLPESVAAAVKTGDPERIANSIEALSGHNGGINAGRRATEAANIRGVTGEGGRPSIRSQVDAMKEIDRMDAPPEVKASAQAQLARKYSIYNAETTKEKAKFNEALKDTTAEAMAHGTVQSPLTPDQFTKQFGDIEGPVQYRKYVADLQFGADYKSLETMPNGEQDKLVEARVPPPGTPGFEEQMKNRDKLLKAAKQIQDQRRDDPAGAVIRNSTVSEAMQGYNPNKPETFQKVSVVRLAAQEVLGIPPDAQTPITKREAQQLMAPLARTLPGSPEQFVVMKSIAEQFKTMFGDNADKAFVYAMRTQGKDQEVARQAAAAMKAIGLGKPIPTEVAKGLDTAKETAATTSAIMGAPMAAWKNVPGFGQIGSDSPAPQGTPTSWPGFGKFKKAAPFSTEPSMGNENFIPPAAITALRADPNPGRVAAFNMKYGGAGVAEAILKKTAGANPKQPSLAEEINAAP